MGRRGAGGPGLEHLFLAADADISLPRWIEALAAESALRAEQGWERAPAVRTVHVGGRASGLGPALPGQIRARLLGGRLPSEEFALEAAWEHLEGPLLEAWVAGGVTRVTTAPLATRGAAPRARLLRAAGLRSWSLELAFARPDLSASRNLERARRILALQPPEVALVEASGTRGAGADDGAADEYLALVALLEEAGYRAWELTSFARPGHEPAHFPAVWRGEPYLGLGPGAHSYDGAHRSWNLDDPAAYLFRVERGVDPAAGRERPGPDARELERIWSGLRLAEGIRFTELPSEARSIQARWAECGWAHPDPLRLRLTPRGWLLVDGLAVELASAGPSGADRGLP